MHIFRRIAAGLAVAAFMAVAPAGAAEDVSIEAFAGRFVGSGLARNDLSEYFDLTLRDLDVTISVKGAGFAISWTTVLRDKGDPDNPQVRRKSTSLTFAPSDRPGVYRGNQEADPLDGRPYTWARLHGQTLTVHSLVIAADGSYELQSYERTLSGAGMALKFTRVRDGETTRSVTGRLIKESD